MSLFRKLRTLQTIVSGCRNWPALVGAKLGLGDGGRVFQLRNGLELGVKESAKTNWGEIFEPAVADVYGIASAEADVIVDVGANIGGFSCLAALSHPKALVFAFEPQEEELALLKRNVERNRLGRVKVIEFAVTCDGRDVVLYAQENVCASNIYERWNGQEIRLKSVTLDVVPFAEARSAFIKLDCEGAEGELIEWLVTHLDRLPEKVVVGCEYHHWCPIPMEQSIGRLTKAGFVVTKEIRFSEPYLFAKRGGQSRAS